jgi:hypothetical protein
MKKWKFLSWNKARTNVFRVQKRILKAVLVSDIYTCLALQKLLIFSNSSRVLAIRFASFNIIAPYLSVNSSKPISLSFLERFNLNNFLFNYSLNWIPSQPKQVFFSNQLGFSNKKNCFSIADYAWQILVGFLIVPAHEAIFNPRSFGFRSNYSFFKAQKVVVLNLSKLSFGSQKRILIITFENTFSFFNYNFFLKKLIIPRTIKLGIFRFLKLGFIPEFPNCLDFNIQNSFNLSILLANILLDGLEQIASSVRVGSHLLIFLNPLDNEKFTLGLIDNFLTIIGLSVLKKNICIFSSLTGFDFLGWHFQVYNNLNVYSSPSMQNYKYFLKRVKNILNNSNYGAV